MKKFLLTLLALFLATTLTACSSDEEGSSESEGNTSGIKESDRANDTIELYSDSTKMVFKNGNTQMIYYYSGEDITAYHAYIDYETAANANYALSLVEIGDIVEKAYTKGRYLVVEYAKETFEDLKVSHVRTLYSYMEQTKNLN